MRWGAGLAPSNLGNQDLKPEVSTEIEAGSELGLLNNKYGIDIGYTKAVHTIWRVYSLGSDRGPANLSGTYVGEQGTVAAGGQAGGNWIYGGPNAEIGMIASGIVKDAGYNLAMGIVNLKGGFVVAGLDVVPGSETKVIFYKDLTTQDS